MSNTGWDKKLWEIKNRFFTAFEIPEQQIMWGWFETNIRQELSKQKADLLARLPEEKEYDNSGLPFNKAWRGGWNECLAEVRKRLEKDND